MNWNDWEFIWRRQEPPVGEAADLLKLKRTFEDNHRRLSRSLAVRDFAEMAAGVFVTVAFARRGWRLGHDGWPFIFVILLCLGVTAVFVRERLRARRERLAPSASLREKVQADLKELRHQRKLIANVATWYLAPLTLAGLIEVVTIRNHRIPANRDPVIFAFTIILMLLIMVAVWMINRRALKKRLDPRLAELEKLHRDLTGSP